MCERNFILGYNRTTQYLARDGRCHQLVLEPGIFVEPIMINLVQLEIVKVGALIVITEDGATSPTGVAPAVFILQAIPQCHESQSAYGHHLSSKPDRTCAFTGAAPYN